LSVLRELRRAARARIVASSTGSGLAAGAELDLAAQDLEAVEARTRTVVRVLREESIYRPDRPEVSWVADLVEASRGDRDAGARLARHSEELAELRRLEARDIGRSTLGALMAPTFVSDATIPSTTPDAVLRDLWFVGEIPPTGDLVLPRFSTGATAGSAADNSLPAESDPATTGETGSVVMITAVVDLSRAVRDRGGPAVDVLVAVELAAALDAETERQVVAGSGSGELLGVLNMSGTSAGTYTDATATPEETTKAVGALATTIAGTTRLRPTVAVCHPRRAEFVLAPRDQAAAGPSPWTALPVEPGDPATSVARISGRPWATCGLIPTNLGASTNEDRIIVTDASAAALWLGPPTVLVGATNLQTTRLSVSRYATLLVRRPAGIGILSGTGLATAL
jgi:HK97 family phage major capsid protein